MDIGKSLRYDIWNLSDKFVPFSFSDRYLFISGPLSDGVERDVWDPIDTSVVDITDKFDF